MRGGGTPRDRRVISSELSQFPALQTTGKIAVFPLRGNLISRRLYRLRSPVLATGGGKEGEKKRTGRTKDRMYLVSCLARILTRHAERREKKKRKRRKTAGLVRCVVDLHFRARSIDDRPIVRKTIGTSLLGNVELLSNYYNGEEGGGAKCPL